MNKKFTIYLTILLFVFVGFLNAQHLNINSLEKEIINYNREGRQKLSQKKLSDLLYSGDLTKEEEASVLFYMAATYRGVSDYMMCIDYLNKSYTIAKDFPKDHILRMKIDYEYAFAYFDNKEYKKSKEMMTRISAQKYSQVIPEDQAYFLMQEGYLSLLNKDFDNASKKYEEAFYLMKSANYCNLPIVYVRMMDLYGKKKNIQKVESIYTQSMKMSKSCGILKYEIYTAAEMERIYKDNDLIEKAFSAGIKVDSLRKLEDLENKVSEMHVIDKKYSERDEQNKNASVFREKVGATALAFVLLSFIAYSFLKSRNLKLEKIKMEGEIIQMKSDLDSYSKNLHFDEKFITPANSIIDYEKLTERQKELIELMAAGLSNKEIADRLFITESTVKYHIKNIYSTLGLKDRKDFFKKINNI